MPEIPDKLHHFLIVMGLFLIGYGYVTNDDKYAEYSKKYATHEAIEDSLEYLNLQLPIEEELFLEKCTGFEKFYNLENIISRNTGGKLAFRQVVTKDSAVNNGLIKLESDWRNLLLLQVKEDLLKQKLGNLSMVDGDAKTELGYWREQFGWMEVLGVILTVLGFVIWVAEIFKKDEEKLVLQAKKVRKCCQSCGNEFNAMRPNAKNADDSINLAFCTSCYSNGEFTEPEVKMEEMFKRYAERKEIKNGVVLRLKRKEFEALERWRR